MKVESVPTKKEGTTDDEEDDASSKDAEPHSDTAEESKGPTEKEEESTVVSGKELPYSTRGRSHDTEADSRVARDALEDLGRKETTSAASLGTSFLETLTEEERHIRTRFLPGVDGIHSLRKLEIKEDLHLARSLVSAGGMIKKKGKRGRNEEEDVDMDADDGTSPSEDSSVVARSGHTIEMGSRDMVVPSNAFVAPPGTKSTTSSEDDDRNSPTPPKTQSGVQSPLVVDSTVAFSPPRPPESIGAKKKHRMLRWERRPEDVESDLANYRKTVQRTRQELHNAEMEYSRLETIDAHLRWHFLNHLNLLNDEYLRLNDEMGSVQQECVESADLFASRTRSRGAGKASYLMRDVLAVLKARGSEPKDEAAMEMEETPTTKTPLPVVAPGIGGLPVSAFSDWSDDSKLPINKPASAWLVAGDKVRTPYGKGEVVTVFPATLEQKKTETSQEDSKSDSSGEMATDTPGGKSKSKGTTAAFKPCAILPPRVLVRLQFGKGYFTLSNITAIESNSLYSDSQLKKRWKSMAETALSVSGSLDVGAMCAIERPGTDEDTEDASGMDVDDTGGGKNASMKDNASIAIDDEDSRFLPFGAGLLPTAFGRGAFLASMPIEEIEKEINHALYGGKGVLGRPTNPGVLDDVKKWEVDEKEFVTLQAEALHLRNNLYRQRRIRLLNERTRNAANERYERAEGLVAEMRTDLKSLKKRLEAELQELGIDDETAERIFLKFYRGDDADVSAGGATPLKRQRRLTRSDEVYEDGKSGDEMDRGSADDMSGDDAEAHRESKKLRPNQ
eukprot:scaffold1869_cov122-Cylindrotheca_fusiformis.AAC.60